ncbi:MAG: cupin domain-containing protein [Actinomycetota bacterium]|nr:cupin domain-containing protein [Actinomycetota bacterium]
MPTKESEAGTPAVHTTLIDDVEPSEVAVGITRRGLPSGQVVARVFDMAPDTVWPVVDHHTSDEFIYVVSGELIEGDTRHSAGSYLHYEAGTSHQPSTQVGVRILVFGAAG